MNTNLGYNLKKYRWEHNMTISELSKLCGICSKTLNNLELYYDGCNTNTLYKICKATNLSADYLLGLSNNKYVL